MSVILKVPFVGAAIATTGGSALGLATLVVESVKT